MHKITQMFVDLLSY